MWWRRQVVLVALPGVDLEAVQREVDAQCDALPRGDTARQALSHSCVVRVDSQACPCPRPHPWPLIPCLNQLFWAAFSAALGTGLQLRSKAVPGLA